ncbi:MAG: hypothetical protein N2578_05450 [Bdellovibrionaceae bacterium]|nr:hypothetical protein [Pseudobdellovibrionaceae bacterium]
MGLSRRLPYLLISPCLLLMVTVAKAQTALDLDLENELPASSTENQELSLEGESASTPSQATAKKKKKKDDDKNEPQTPAEDASATSGPDPVSESTLPPPAGPTFELPQEPPAVSSPEPPTEPSAEPSVEPLPPEPVPEPVQEAKITAGPSDEPDLRLEEKFHRWWRERMSTPTSDSKWNFAIDGKPKEYVVQKGDTLSQISNVLFGDMFFYPKVWSQNNDQIFNPHEIEPGMVIYFYPGTSEKVPIFSIGRIRRPGPRVNLSGESYQLPPSKPIVPPLRSIPDSLPLYRYAQPVNTEVDISGAQVSREIPAADMSMPYILVEGPSLGAGRIRALETDSNHALEFQYVVVEVKDPTGKVFHAVRPADEVWDRDYKRSRAFAARMIEVQGEIELTESIDPTRGIWRAIVRKNIVPIAKDAILLPGPMPTMNVSSGPESQSVSAKIIGGSQSDRRQVFGFGELVFLAKGSNHGLSAGMNLPVFADLSLRNKSALAKNIDRRIGGIKILQTTPNYSVGLVTESQQEILTGDYVGAPPSQSSSDSSAQARSSILQEEKEPQQKSRSDQNPNNDLEEELLEE